MEKFKAHLSIILAVFIFGANYRIAKGIMPEPLNPFQVVFLRIAGALILFFIIRLFIPRQKIEKKDIKIIALCALLGIAINQLTFFIALRFSTPVDVAILHVCNPIIVFFIMVLMYHEKISRSKALGILFGASGAILLIINGFEFSFQKEHLIGNILAMVNTTAYAFYLVLSKPIVKKYHPVNFMFYIYLFGFIIVFPFLIKTTTEINFNLFETKDWFTLFYIIFFTTFLGYLLVMYSLKHLNPTTVSYYNYLQPIVAALISIYLNEQGLTYQNIIASVLIFSGVYFVSIKKNKTIIKT